MSRNSISDQKTVCNSMKGWNSNTFFIQHFQGFKYSKVYCHSVSHYKSRYLKKKKKKQLQKDKNTSIKNDNTETMNPSTIVQEYKNVNIALDYCTYNWVVTQLSNNYSLCCWVQSWVV